MPATITNKFRFYNAYQFMENFKDVPILSSYAPFTASNTSFTTHSFELSSSKVYSNSVPSVFKSFEL